MMPEDSRRFTLLGTWNIRPYMLTFLKFQKSGHRRPVGSQTWIYAKRGGKSHACVPSKDKYVEFIMLMREYRIYYQFSIDCLCPIWNWFLTIHSNAYKRYCFHNIYLEIPKSCVLPQFAQTCHLLKPHLAGKLKDCWKYGSKCLLLLWGDFNGGEGGGRGPRRERSPHPRDR
jgi:hypothetical protein